MIVVTRSARGTHPTLPSILRAPHNGRRMPSRRAITDSGSGFAGRRSPRCWASYCSSYKCPIPALELGPRPARLNQSRIWAVESSLWRGHLLVLAGEIVFAEGAADLHERLGRLAPGVQGLARLAAEGLPAASLAAIASTPRQADDDLEGSDHRFGAVRSSALSGRARDRREPTRLTLTRHSRIGEVRLIFRTFEGRCLHRR